ncbi:hypothetical protein AcV5_006307 [Taiwanofungus camphoratus]|nr:hypothetical protein AcV5_006307 [Antrodia cinnamomea]
MSTSQDIRLISPVNTGRESSSPPWGCGNVAFRQIQMSGVTSEIFSRTVSQRRTPGLLQACHYANKSWSPAPSLVSHILSRNNPSPRPQLIRPADRAKDQTYYLSAIPEASLARAIFPLASFTKPQVRAMAHTWGLPTAKREESMGLCFVGEKRRFHEFLSQYITPSPGSIIDVRTGKSVGTHAGMWSYTVGQGARLPGMPEKMFVAQKDPRKNEIYIVPGSNHPDLFCNTISARDWSWIWADSPPPAIDDQAGFRCQIKYIYRMEDVPCVVRRSEQDGTMRITFDKPQKAVAPGQIAVIYVGDWCLGCGIITQTE